jgi:hypothetical protein
MPPQVHQIPVGAAVERAGKRNSKELLGDDSRSIGHHQQDQQLQQQEALHNGAPIATCAFRTPHPLDSQQKRESDHDRN